MTERMEKMKRKSKGIIAVVLLFFVVLSGCRDGRGYKDGIIQHRWRNTVMGIRNMCVF